MLQTDKALLYLCCCSEPLWLVQSGVAFCLCVLVCVSLRLRRTGGVYTAECLCQWVQWTK